MAPPARRPAERLGCAARFYAEGAACADVGWRRFPVEHRRRVHPAHTAKAKKYYRLKGIPSKSGPERASDLLDLDLDVDAGREVEALKRLDRLRRRLHDVDE